MGRAAAGQERGSLLSRYRYSRFLFNGRRFVGGEPQMARRDSAETKDSQPRISRMTRIKAISFSSVKSVKSMVKIFLKMNDFELL